MQISLSNEQEHVDVTEKTANVIEEAIRTTLSLLAANPDTGVDVTIVDDAAMQQLNREWRGVDDTTDVLAFALNEADGSDIELEGSKLLGDVVVSIERATAQAEEYGHSLDVELAFLAIHGTLHLVGFDHQDEAERAAMRLKEDAVLQLLGLSRNDTR